MSFWMTSGASRLKARQSRSFSERAQQRASGTGPLSTTSMNQDLLAGGKRKKRSKQRNRQFAASGEVSSEPALEPRRGMQVSASAPNLYVRQPDPFREQELLRQIRTQQAAQEPLCNETSFGDSRITSPLVEMDQSAQLSAVLSRQLAQNLYHDFLPEEDVAALQVASRTAYTLSAIRLRHQREQQHLLHVHALNGLTGSTPGASPATSLRQALSPPFASPRSTRIPLHLASNFHEAIAQSSIASSTPILLRRGSLDSFPTRMSDTQADILPGTIRSRQDEHTSGDSYFRQPAPGHDFRTPGEIRSTVTDGLATLRAAQSLAPTDPQPHENRSAQAKRGSDDSTSSISSISGSPKRIRSSGECLSPVNSTQLEQAGTPLVEGYGVGMQPRVDRIEAPAATLSSQEQLASDTTRNTEESAVTEKVSPRTRKSTEHAIRFFDKGLEVDVTGNPFPGADDATRLSIPPKFDQKNDEDEQDDRKAASQDCYEKGDGPEEKPPDDDGMDEEELVKLQDYQQSLWDQFAKPPAAKKTRRRRKSRRASSSEVPKVFDPTKSTDIDLSTPVMDPSKVASADVEDLVRDSLKEREKTLSAASVLFGLLKKPHNHDPGTQDR